MSCNDPLERSTAPASEKAGGFTLIELLVVIGVLSLLAATLIPIHAANRSGSQGFQCLNNHRQLAVGWITSAADNADRLPSTMPVAGHIDWNPGNPDNVDTELLVDPQQSMIARYVSIPDVWKCPADTVPTANGLRVRSVSFNGSLNGSSVQVIVPGYPPGREYLPVANYSHQLRKPSEVFLSIDEHSDSINDSVFMFNPGELPLHYQWRDLPASYHNGAAGFSAADGRGELHRWVEEGTKQPILQQAKPWGSGFYDSNSLDVEWMNNMMPYREL